MTGHLYQRQLRDRVRWYAVIDTAAPGASRKQTTRSFASKRAAQAWLVQMAAKRQAQRDSPLVEDYLRDWLSGRVALRASTTASYRAHIEHHLIPALGDVTLAQLRPETIQRLHHQLLAQGMTPATLARVHATLSAALNTAHRRGLLLGDPLAGVELPRTQPPDRIVWTLDHARAFLVAVTGDDLEALWRLALLTGMRRGELLGLRWADLDLDAGRLRVVNTRITIGATIVEGPPKTRASHRTLSLDARTTNLLRDRQDPSGHVFTDAEGNPLAPGWVSRRFTEICTNAGLPRIRFHDVRHTSATLGLATGESLKAVSTRLGHADISVTANTYLQVPDHIARRDATRLADLLDTSAVTQSEGAA